MKKPNPIVMRTIFNDPKLLQQLSLIVRGKSKTNTIVVNGKEYLVKVR